MDLVATLVARQAPSSGPPELTPATSPPPGVTPNFLNPVSRQQQLADATIACMVFSVLFLAMRLYTRLSITRSLGWDDYTAVLAMAFIVTYSGCVLHILSFGVGKHMWDVSKAEYDRINFLRWNVILYVLYLAAIGIVKISILLLYLRLFSISRATRYSVYACMLFVGGYIVAGELSLLFGCQPVKKIFNIFVPGKCIDVYRHTLAQAILNIISDAMLVAIPAPAAWALQLPKRQKIAIIAIFGTGSVACIASAIRLHYIKDGNLPSRIMDNTWAQADGFFWSVIELHLAMVCSCMTAFKPFLQHYMPLLRKVSSRILSYGTSSTSTSGKLSNDSSGTRSELDSKTKAEFVELHENPNHTRYDEETVAYATRQEGWNGYNATDARNQRWPAVVSESQERIVQ